VKREIVVERRKLTEPPRRPLPAPKARHKDRRAKQHARKVFRKRVAFGAPQRKSGEWDWLHDEC
jgi:hypothetical protein